MALPEGVYIVEISQVGFEKNLVYSVILKAGQESDDTPGVLVSVVDPVLCYISGKVANRRHQGIKDAKVYAWKISNGEKFEAKTNGSGEYRMDTTMGEYEVTSEVNGLRSKPQKAKLSQKVRSKKLNFTF